MHERPAQIYGSHNDYRSRDKNGWQKSEGKRKWRTTIAIFFALFLVFASINGFVKTIAAGRAIAKAKWDSTSTFAVSLSDKAQSVFLFQKDPKRAVVLYLGNKDSTGSGEDSAKNISVTLGAPVENFVKFGDEKLTNAESVKDEYAKFKSFYTAARILTTGWGNEDMNTNISRIDAFKLWWQLKDVGVDELEFADLSAVSNDVDNKNKKVLAADTLSLNREVADYFENIKVAKEDYQVDIVNASGDYQVSSLAANFVNAVGGRVGSISGDTTVVASCTITAAEKGYTTTYLAKLFECDITDAAFGQDEDLITLVLGSDFAQKYF